MKLKWFKYPLFEVINLNTILYKWVDMQFCDICPNFVIVLWKFCLITDILSDLYFFFYTFDAVPVHSISISTFNCKWRSPLSAERRGSHEPHVLLGDEAQGRWPGPRARLRPS